MTEQCWKISGRVQRVGYRRWAISKAEQIGGLSGYVHNDIGGDVFILVSGNNSDINLFKQECYKGPLFARVDSIIDCPELKMNFPAIKNGCFSKI